MMNRRKTLGVSRMFTAIGGALALAATLGACASNSDVSEEPASNAASFDEAIAALLPESIREGGVLNVALPDGSPPLSSVDESGNAVGMDPDLAQAIGEVLGLEVELFPGTFDSQIPGLQAGRYHIAMGEYYVTSERLASVDFVTEWRDFTSFATLADNEWSPETADELCGYQIGVMKGSAEEASITTYSDENCGSNAMQISAFPDQAASFLALDSGRIDAVVTGRGPLESAAAQNDKIKISGEYGGGPTATAVARNEDSDAMLQALKAAFDAIIDNGTYAEILETWSTGYGALEEAEIYTEDSTPPVYN